MPAEDHAVAGTRAVMTAQLIDAGIARKAVELLRAQSRPLDLVLARAGLGNDALEQKWARIP